MAFGTETGPLGGQLVFPKAVAVHRDGSGGGGDGDVYVANAGNRRVEVFSADGEFERAFGFDVVASGQSDTGAAPEVCRLASTPQDVCQAGASSGAAGAFVGIEALAIDQATGNIFVAEGTNRRVSVFSPDGTFQAAFGFRVNASSPAAQLQVCTTSTGCQVGLSTPLGGGFVGPGAIAVDPRDSSRVYVADGFNRRINELSLDLDANDRVTGASFVRAFGWDVVASGEHNSANNEEQRLTPTGASGTFTVLFTGVESAPISYNATPAQVQTVLENMSTIGAGNVSVTSPNPGGGVAPGGPYDVTFQGVLGGNDVAAMTRAATSAVTITTITPGGAYEICRAASTPADVCKAGAIAANPRRPADVIPTSVAVDADGQIYATSATRLQVFQPDGTFDRLFGPTTGDCPTNGAALSDVAIDPTDGHVFVTHKPTETTMTLCELTPDEQLVETSPTTPLDVAAGTDLAIGLATEGRIYVNTPLNASTGAGAIALIGDIPPPQATVAPPSAITTTSATLNGTVTIPQPGVETTYRFEYSSDGTTWTKAPAANASVGDEPGDHQVSQPIDGLTPSTLYIVRLIASNGLSMTSPPTTFTTASAAPLVAQATADAQHTTASLTALVWPHNQPTTYRFEWGPAATYGNRTPAIDTELATVIGPLAASENLENLTPNTTYHYRVVATNPTGTTAGPDHTFTTYPLGSRLGPRVVELTSH